MIQRLLLNNDAVPPEDNVPIHEARTIQPFKENEIELHNLLWPT
jgi:hypothetical protein